MNSDDTIYYFAYGMNTCRAIMDRHDVCSAIGAATLNGYHLVLKYHASIMQGGSMQGVLWEINKDTLAAIDMQEGYPTYYNRIVVTVECNGKTYNAHTYIMSEHNTPAPLMILGPIPSMSYLKYIYNGYKEFEIPLSQLYDALSSIPEDRQ